MVSMNITIIIISVICWGSDRNIRPEGSAHAWTGSRGANFPIRTANICQIYFSCIFYHILNSFSLNKTFSIEIYVIIPVLIMECCRICKKKKKSEICLRFGSEYTYLGNPPMGRSLGTDIPVRTAKYGRYQGCVSLSETK
jgi:hypothetical protein